MVMLGGQQTTLAPYVKMVPVDKTEGSPKKIVRSHYEATKDEQMLLTEFEEWSDRPDFLVFHNLTKGRYFAVPSAKRGNSRYRWRVRTKFEQVRLAVASMDHMCGKRRTSVLFLTLTYKQDEHIDYYWKNVSKHWNIFMTRLRKEFGKVDAIRVYETTRKGFPHIHAVLFFKDHSFRIRRHRDGRGKAYRLVRYPSFLKEHWIHGFSDWSGVQVLGRIVNYVIKYLTKQLTKNEETRMMLAKMWIYDKRAFSLSKSISDLVRRLDNTSVTQTTERDDLEFLGTFTSDLPLNKMIIRHVEVWREPGEGIVGAGLKVETLVVK